MKNNLYSDLKWGISTLGCPELDLPGAVALADRYGMNFLEIRTLQNSNEPWNTLYYPENSSALRRLVEAGRCRVLDSSFGLTAIKDDAREALVKTAQAADDFNIPYIRVFGGGGFADEFTAERVQCAMDNLAWYREQGFRAKLALETHDICSSTDRCCQLVEASQGELMIIWDAHHTLRVAGDDLRYTFDKLKPQIVTVHFKDSVDAFDDKNERYCEYTLPGEGKAELAQLFAMLNADKPDFPVIFEHEKFWRKYLPELSTALDAWQSFCKQDQR